MALTAAELEAVLRLRDELSPAMRVAAANVMTATTQINVGLNSVADSAAKTGVAAVAMGGMVQQAVASIGQAVMGAVGSAVDLAGRYEALGGVSKFLTSSLGMTGKETDKLAASLNKQGISMIESRNSIVQLARANLDLNKATQLGTVAQSAARLAGANSSETLQRLIFGIQTLQPEVLRTSGIIVNLEKSYSDFAAANNKTVASLSGQEKQQAALNAVLKEGERIAGVYGVTNDFVAGKEQSLKRVRDDAYTKLGTTLLPMQMLWVQAQTDLYKAIGNHPQLFLAIATAVTAMATAWGAVRIPIIGPYLKQIIDLSKAAVSGLMTLAASTGAAATAQAAKTATSATAVGVEMGLAGMIDAQTASTTANTAATTTNTGSTWLNTAAKTAWSAAMGVAAAANAAGTAAMATGTALLSGQAVTATAALSALGVAASVVGAAFAGYKFGEWISGLKLLGSNLTIGQQAEKGWVWLFNLPNGLKAANAAAGEFARGIDNNAEVMRRQEAQAKASAERVKQLREELNKSPKREMELRVQEVGAELKTDLASGLLNEDRLKQYKLIIDKIKKDAAESGIKVNLSVNGMDVLQTVEAKLASIGENEVKNLRAAVDGLAPGTEDFKAQIVAAGERAKDLKERFPSIGVELDDLIAKAKGFADEIAKAKPKIPDLPAEAAARAELLSQVGKASGGRADVAAAFTKELKSKTGPEIIEFQKNVKAVTGKMDDLAMTPQKFGSNMERANDKTRELAKAGQEAARALRGFMGPDELTKASATVATLGGAANMTAAQTLKVGEELAKAAAAGQKLSPELTKVAQNYNEIAAAKMVAQAKGFIDDEEIAKMERLFSTIDLSKLDTETLAKIGEPIAKAAQNGQDLGSQLNGVAAAALNAKDELLAMSLSGALTPEMSREYQNLEAALGKVKGGVEAMPSAKIKETADQLYTLAAAGMPLSSLDQQVLALNADMERMAAVGGMTKDELAKLDQLLVTMGGNFPTEFALKYRDALEATARAGKELTDRQKELLAAARLAAGQQIARVGEANDGSRAVADFKNVMAEMRKAYGENLQKLGDDGVANLMANWRKIASEAQSFDAIKAATAEADKLFATLSDQGKTNAAVAELMANLESLPDNFAKGGKEAEELIQALYGVSPELAKIIAGVVKSQEALKTATKHTFDWQGALEGAAILAGMFSGKLGEMINVVGNIAQAFQNAQTDAEKFGAVLSGLGQIGGIVGGQIGTALQGAMGGGKMGMAIGGMFGPIGGMIGGAIGAVAGGILGFIKGGKVKAAAKEAGRILGREVSQEQAKAMMEEAKKLGISVKELAQKMRKEEVEAAKKQREEIVGAGLDKAIAGMRAWSGKLAAAGAEQGRIYAATFAAMVSEKGIVAAAEAFKDQIEEIRKISPQLAADIEKWTKPGPLQDAAVAAKGLADTLVGLTAAGYMDQSLFTDFGATAQAAFAQAQAGGATTKEALVAIAPLLAQMKAASEQYGFTLDANTQGLIDQAEAAGIAFKTDPMLAMLDVLVEIAKVLGADIPASVQKMKDAATVSATETAAATTATAAAAAAATTATASTAIQQMAAIAQAGGDQAAEALKAAIDSGAIALGEFANDPSWAELIAQLSSEVPGAAAAAAAAIAAIANSVPSINIPVNVGGGGGGGGEAPPEGPPPPEEYAGGTRGWRNFGRGRNVILHGTEAVVRPGDPVLPGQINPSGGTQTIVNLSINENPMQTAETVEQMRRFTLKSAERELQKSLSMMIENGKA